MLIEKIKWEKEFIDLIEKEGTSWTENETIFYIEKYKIYKRVNEDISFLIWLRRYINKNSTQTYVE